jgi:hypothetical protein
MFEQQFQREHGRGRRERGLLAYSHDCGHEREDKPLNNYGRGS